MQTNIKIDYSRAKVKKKVIRMNFLGGYFHIFFPSFGTLLR
jgi:hypothetical protein